MAARAELDVGDHHPVDLARAAVRDAHLPRRACRRFPTSSTRPLRSTARTRGSASATITLPLLKPLIAIQLLFGVIYSVYQFAIPYVMMGTNPGPYADLLMTLIVRQAFTNNLFGYGAAISSLLMFAMLGWVAVWYLSFRRSLEPAT